MRGVPENSAQLGGPEQASQGAGGVSGWAGAVEAGGCQSRRWEVRAACRGPAGLAACDGRAWEFGPCPNGLWAPLTLATWRRSWRPQGSLPTRIWEQIKQVVAWPAQVSQNLLPVALAREAVDPSPHRRLPSSALQLGPANTWTCCGFVQPALPFTPYHPQFPRLHPRKLPSEQGLTFQAFMLSLPPP